MREKASPFLVYRCNYQKKHVILKPIGGVGMIDAKKVRMMTKLAIYEEGIGKKELKMNRSSKSTYLNYKQLESVIAVTIAYILGVVLYSVRYYTDIMAQGLTFQYKDILINVLIGYVLVMVVNIFFTKKIAGRQYDEMKKNIKEYDRRLFHLNKYLEDEELSK